MYLSVLSNLYLRLISIVILPVKQKVLRIVLTQFNAEAPYS